MTHRHRHTAVCCSLIAVLAMGCADDDELAAIPDPTTTASTTTSTTAVPTTSDTTTTAPPTTAAPSPPLFDQAGAIKAGTYLVDKFDTPLHVTVPAGWSAIDDFVIVSPEGWEVGYLGFWEVDDVNLDACHWHGRAHIGPSVDDLVAGLTSQLGMDVTDPNPIDVDGRTGQALTLSPADVDPAACDEAVVSPWFEADGDSRDYAGPGETETVWIVDLDGHRALLSVGSLVEKTASSRKQLDEMFASIRVG